MAKAILDHVSSYLYFRVTLLVEYMDHPFRKRI